jgi:hypothetical protein
VGRREPPLGGKHGEVEVSPPQGGGEGTPEHGGDDNFRSERHPRSAYPHRNDRLAEGYDHHEAVTLGEVPCMDPEALDAADYHHTVGESERHCPECALGISVEQAGHDK